MATKRRKTVTSSERRDSRLLSPRVRSRSPDNVAVSSVRRSTSCRATSCTRRHSPTRCDGVEVATTPGREFDVQTRRPIPFTADTKSERRLKSCGLGDVILQPMFMTNLLWEAASIRKRTIASTSATGG